MTFSTGTRYLLVFFAVLTGSVIELHRGYPRSIVLIAFITFLLAGFAITYLSNSTQRALRRQQKRDYYSN